MASPDQDTQFIVIKRPEGPTYDTPESAQRQAESHARSTPGVIYTVYQAIADFQAGDIPVTRSDYRQRPTKKEPMDATKGE